MCPRLNVHTTTKSGGHQSLKSQIFVPPLFPPNHLNLSQLKKHDYSSGAFHYLLDENSSLQSTLERQAPEQTLSFYSGWRLSHYYVADRTESIRNSSPYYTCDKLHLHCLFSWALSIWHLQIKVSVCILERCESSVFQHRWYEYDMARSLMNRTYSMVQTALLLKIKTERKFLSLQITFPLLLISGC